MKFHLLPFFFMTILNAAFAQDVAQALAYLHHQRVVHLDIKVGRFTDLYNPPILTVA